MNPRATSAEAPPTTTTTSGDDLVLQLQQAVQQQDVFVVARALRLMHAKGMLYALNGKEGVNKILPSSGTSALMLASTGGPTPVRRSILKLLLLCYSGDPAKVPEQSQSKENWAVEMLRSWDPAGRRNAQDMSRFLRATEDQRQKSLTMCSSISILPPPSAALFPLRPDVITHSSQSSGLNPSARATPLTAAPDALAPETATAKRLFANTPATRSSMTTAATYRQPGAANKPIFGLKGSAKRSSDDEKLQSPAQKPPRKRAKIVQKAAEAVALSVLASMSTLSANSMAAPHLARAPDILASSALLEEGEVVEEQHEPELRTLSRRKRARDSGVAFLCHKEGLVSLQTTTEASGEWFDSPQTSSAADLPKMEDHDFNVVRPEKVATPSLSASSVILPVPDALSFPSHLTPVTIPPIVTTPGPARPRSLRRTASGSSPYPSPEPSVSPLPSLVATTLSRPTTAHLEEGDALFVPFPPPPPKRPTRPARPPPPAAPSYVLPSPQSLTLTADASSFNPFAGIFNSLLRPPQSASVSPSLITPVPSSIPRHASAIRKKSALVNPQALGQETETEGENWEIEKKKKKKEVGWRGAGLGKGQDEEKRELEEVVGVGAGWVAEVYGDGDRDGEERDSDGDVEMGHEEDGWEDDDDEE
ncbi:hypothetical protein JCM11641_002038 [Rhodosporidiobolus odoratus]